MTIFIVNVKHTTVTLTNTQLMITNALHTHTVANGNVFTEFLHYYIPPFNALTAMQPLI